MLNLNEFLGTQVDGASSTRLLLLNEGDYVAQIAADGIDLKDFKFKKGDREGQTGYRMTVKWEVQDPDGSIEKTLGRKPTIVQSIMLDLTESGGLDMGKGKNVALGRLREAVGQNTDGRPWQPAMLIGQMARIQVKHRMDDKNELQHDVNAVTKIQ